MRYVQQVVEDLCPAGAVNRTDQKFFKNKGEGEAEGGAKWGEEQRHDEEWEQLGIAEIAKQRQQRRKSLRQSNMDMSSKFKIRASRRMPNFDHEASFVENEGASKEGDGGLNRHRETALMRAIKAGKWQEVAKILVDQPETVNEADQFEQTPVFYASGAGHVEALQTLLDYDAQVDCANKFGYTPLMRACRHNRVEVAEELFRHGADLKAEDKYQATALQVAATVGATEIVDWILQKPQAEALVEHKDCDGVTSLLAAVRKSQVEVARMLLEARASPACTDESGRQPLVFALAANDLDLVHMLIGHSADVNAEDEGGRSVLLALVENIVKFKSKKEFKVASLAGLACALEAKADPDVQNESGVTPLLFAAKSDEPMTCAMLAAYNADVFTQDDQDRSALSIALKKGYIDVSKVLQDFGAVRVFKNEKLNRMLFRVVFYGSTDACSTLLDRGADPAAPTRGGKAATSIALQAGSVGCYRLMTSVGGQSIAKDPKGSMKDKDVLKLWLKELRAVGGLFGRLQRGVRICDADIIADALMELIRNENQLEHDSTAAIMLADYLRSRRSAIIRKAITDLRKIRARVRRKNMVAFAKELVRWDTVGDRMLADLQKICSSGVNSVRGVKASQLEQDDKYSKDLDDFQLHVINDPLILAGDLAAAYIEADAAYKNFPTIESMKDESDPFQCPKCLNVYAHQAALNDHSKFCRSTLGEEQQNAKDRRFQAKLDTGIFHLVTIAKTLEKKAEVATELWHKVKTKAELAMTPQKGLPEAVPALQGCQKMLEALRRIFITRARALEERATKEAASWGLKNPYANVDVTAKMVTKYCHMCFVKEITRACAHEDGKVKPHKCLCSACAFDISLRMRSGDRPLCPMCRRPIKSFMVARLGADADKWA